MGYLRLPLEQLHYVLLQHVVGVGHALMLAQMLRPRGHEERLQKPCTLATCLRRCPMSWRRPATVRVEARLELIETIAGRQRVRGDIRSSRALVHPLLRSSALQPAPATVSTGSDRAVRRFAVSSAM